MTDDDRWLASQWPFVRAALAPPPARVVEIGCGPLGGFVPALRDAGYDALGVDPEAPEGADYRRMNFEQYEPSEKVAGVVASTALHHVKDVARAVDRIIEMLVPGGAVAIVEWAWEHMDEATARWCFARLSESASDTHDWLHHRRDEWHASGLGWDDYWRAWAAEEGLHPAGAIVTLLDARLDRRSLEYGPCLFPDLPGTTEEEEQAAIAAGQIRATRIRYAGTRR